MRRIVRTEIPPRIAAASAKQTRRSAITRPPLLTRYLHIAASCRRQQYFGKLFERSDARVTVPLHVRKKPDAFFLVLPREEIAMPVRPCALELLLSNQAVPDCPLF